MAIKLQRGADLSAAGSWSPAGVPEDGDDVYFDAESVTVTAGETALSAIALASCHFLQEWEGRADTYIELGVTTVWIGEHYGTGDAPGSPNLMVKVAGASTVHVLNTSTTSAVDYKPPVQIHLNHADAKVYLRKGSIGIGLATPAEAGRLDVLSIGYEDDRDGDATAIVGAGITLATLDKTGGKATLFCGATTITNAGGDLVTEGTGAVGTLNAGGGNVVPNSTGTITTVNATGGVLDCLRSTAPRTITTLNISDEAQVKLGDHITVGTLAVSGRISLQASEE